MLLVCYNVNTHMFLEVIEMKNEDLKDRLLQDKDAKALENGDLSKVPGGD